MNKENKLNMKEDYTAKEKEVIDLFMKSHNLSGDRDADIARQVARILILYMYVIMILLSVIFLIVVNIF